MIDIDYPTIHLFLYDLLDGIGRDEDDVEKIRHQFWKCIYPDIDKEKLQAFKEIELEFETEVLLLKGNKDNIEIFDNSLDGYYLPSKIDDSYSLQVNCSGKLNDQIWDSLSSSEKLRRIKEYIDLNIYKSELRNKEDFKSLSLDEKVRKIKSTSSYREHPILGSLGKNWLIWGKLATLKSSQEVKEKRIYYEKIAKECFEASNIFVNPNWEQDLKSQGTYKGTIVFEVERRDYIPDGKNNNFYALIFLLPENIENFQVMGTLYGQLNRLFYYRNKVLWAYEQSRQIRQSLKEQSASIHDLVQALADQVASSDTNLDELQRILGQALLTSYSYETKLSYLQEQISTLSININNYKKRLKSLLDSAHKDDDLSFLKNFGKYAKNKYLDQAETDKKSLAIGLNPLGNFVNVVEGIIEIEKAKNEQISNENEIQRTLNERNFNKTIAIAGVGISTASLAASALGDQVDGIVKSQLPVKANQPTPVINFWANFGVIFFLSLVIGVFLAFVTWLILGRRAED